MRNLLVSSLTAVLTSVLVLQTSPVQAAGALDKIDSSIDELTDKDRGKRGLVAVDYDACLDGFAEKQARRQARQKRMFHQDVMLVLTTCDLSSVGENVAYGYTTAASVQRGWMNSPAHRANILAPDFDTIGVGVARSSTGTLYYAVVFGGR